MLVKITADSLKSYPKVNSSDKTCNRILDLWNLKRDFIVMSGPPGAGKTRAAQDLVLRILSELGANFTTDQCRLTNLFPNYQVKHYTEIEIAETLLTNKITFIWEISVLHSSYSYEDLIRGYRVNAVSGSESTLNPKEGVLGFISRVTSIMEKKAIDNKNLPNSVLILDEINRAPIGQLFGEALFALDRRGTSVATPITLEDLGPGFSIPKSLLICGTMNSTDRSITGLDLALRRRITVINLNPSKDVVLNRFQNTEVTMKNAVSNLFDLIQELISESNQIGSIPKSDLAIGVSFFIPPSELADTSKIKRWIATIYLYQVLPTLQEYKELGFLEFEQNLLTKIPLFEIIEGTKNTSQFEIEDCERAIFS